MNAKGEEKYGESSTHWHKLVPRVNLGGGGECPLLLVGIEPERVDGVEELLDAEDRFRAADEFKAGWRNRYVRWSDAKPIYEQMIADARAVSAAADESH